MSGRAVEFLVWWAALSLVWLGTLATGNPMEITVGVAGASLGAVAAVVARRALDASWPPARRWLRWAARLPGTLLADSIRVLFGRSRPTTREVRVAGDAAMAAAVVNATPGTVVLDARDDTLVLHALGDKASTLERELTR
ncbi:Na+/H+ antiporter subunit E [Labedaea rhizosphaerae]|uniref:Multisubunit Na+/H+ antiporter MnhE subunit n=1 Tax=Labedaea rhizosphaerae TaxID=598644 RepID=A0A4R6SFT9_LABRH|nr:Na+/H+ antiporter subunit E [Labedaea rhizosphaerae]TDQ00882.1 multisubunit Na+/H+ antiporter MnhE subunit [Labedaea rhizosphaerae]